MKRVLVRGPLLTQSGYGVHARQIFEFCENQKDWQVDVEALPWGITPWIVGSDYENGLYGKIMQKTTTPKQQYDISFQVQLPHEWNPSLAKFNVGITAGVETTRCSSDWATVHREKMNLIIVPSSFTKTTMIRSGNGSETTPIVVLPEAYFPQLLNDPTDDPLRDIKTSKNILMVGALTSENPASDRKNLLNSVLWFMKAFKGNPEVGLVVKTSKGRDTTIDRELVRKMLRQVKNMHKQDSKKSPKIYLLHGAMTREEMNNLYKSPKLCAFASATRGEGFGLPMLEAAVAGIPIVATNWSAHTEFLGGKSFAAVVCDMTPIPDNRIDGTIFVAGSSWAEPREGNFCRKLKLTVNENKKLLLAAEELSARLKKSHSHDTLQKKFQKIVMEHVGK